MNDDTIFSMDPVEPVVTAEPVADAGYTAAADADVFEDTAAPAAAPAAEPADDVPAWMASTAAGGKTKEKKKKSGRKGAVALVLCCALLGGAAGAGGAAAVNAWNDKETEEEQKVTMLVEGRRETSVIELTAIDTSRLMTPAEVYAANVGSTVGITTSITTNYWGYQTTSAASGSGFIISSDGYILTNFHVIENSSSITVTTFDGTAYDAALIGYDQSNDIAVLKVEAEGLIPVILGDSDNLNVGDDVVAIGNPLGELTFSLTAGYVSAKDRQVTISGTGTMNLIQTDCAINSGNSGGALFNLYGEVIGVTNAKYSSSSASEASIDNIGFAIPVNSVRDIVESIIEKGYISKPYLGVQLDDVSEQYQMFGLPAGAAIQYVEPDSPAEACGLMAGDIVTAMDGTEVTCANDLVELVGAREVGDTLKLTVYRQGQTLEITAVIGEQVQSAMAEDTSSQQYQQGQQYSSGTFPFGFGFMP